MAKRSYLLASVLFACPAAAQAADKYWVGSEFTTYSNGFGSRRETTAQSSFDLGRTVFTIGATQGTRKFASGSSSAARVAGSVSHDWTDRFYTRTTFTLSSNKPVFATREVGTDFNYKVTRSTVVTAGVKQSRYFGNRDAFAWSAGGSWHFSRGMLSYRYTNYDIQNLGSSNGHVASLRFNDAKAGGSTQLWLSAGSSLQEQELALAGSRGSYRSIALQRVQPIKGPVSLQIAVGNTWYRTPGADYRGTKASIGLAFTGWPKL